jgi:glycosyltransferase involved in cell wall biosynthesis
MRVLAIFHSGGISGPLRTLLPRLRALAEGGEVRLLFPGQGAGTDLVRDELVVETAAYGPTVLPAPTEAVLMPVRLARELLVLRRAIREADPDVVLVVTAYLPLALVAARLEGVPTVLYAAELLGRRGGLAAKAGGTAFRRSARLATRIVASSDEVAGQFTRARVEVVSPGIAPTPPSAVADLPGTPPRIAVVGALSRGRGQDVAFDALPLVRDEAPEASLLVAGEPHARPADEAFAAGLRSRASEGVHFLGAVADIWSLLAAVDVVVVPNRVDEGFGRVAFEAVAVGTPVVTTPLTAAARLLSGRHLLVVDPGRPDLLAHAVLRLLRDPELMASRASTEQQWVAENLDESVLGRHFAGVVRSVAGSRRSH